MRQLGISYLRRSRPIGGDPGVSLSFGGFEFLGDDRQMLPEGVPRVHQLNGTSFLCRIFTRDSAPTSMSTALMVHTRLTSHVGTAVRRQLRRSSARTAFRAHHHQAEKSPSRTRISRHSSTTEGTCDPNRPRGDRFRYRRLRDPPRLVRGELSPTKKRQKTGPGSGTRVIVRCGCRRPSGSGEPDYRCRGVCAWRGAVPQPRRWSWRRW